MDTVVVIQSTQLRHQSLRSITKDFDEWLYELDQMECTRNCCWILLLIHSCFKAILRL